MPERHEQLCALIAARLERVRGNLTDAQFAQLVEDVAQTALRFEEIEARARAVSAPRAVAAVTPPDAPLGKRPSWDAKQVV